MHLSVVAEGVETKEQLSRLEEAGCDYVQGYYFAKPMPCREFEKLLAEESVSTLFKNKKEESEPEEKKEVLILAEEDSTFRKQIKSGLKKEFCVFEACDGREVLRLLSWYKKRIAGVILSLTLPGPDVLAVAEQMKRDRDLESIPVIVSSEPDPEAEEKALEAGADDFIGSPFAVKSLLKRLRRTREAIHLRAREELFQADQGLYHGKEEGRESCSLWGEEGYGGTKKRI